MLHDGLPRPRPGSATDAERRSDPRLPYPAELVLAWHCSMHDSNRYRIIDVSDGGFRIRSAVPLVQGMTGTVLRILPEGHELADAVMVVWCRAGRDPDSYDVGLRRL